MRVAAEIGDGEAWNRADEGFHRAIFDLCGNPRLAAAGHSFRDKAQRAHFVALRLVPIEQKDRSIEAHSELISMLESGDVDTARRNHRRQRHRGATLLVDALKQMQLQQL